MALDFLNLLNNNNIVTHVIKSVNELNTFGVKNNICNNFTILNNNIRSLNKNSDELSVFLKALRYNFSVIVCTETWFVEFPELYTIDGYTIHSNKSTFNQNDGVVVYVRNSNYSVKPLTLII